ncbi:MAG: outer membrane beta-barrel family protein [Bacteroidota bacterium]
MNQPFILNKLCCLLFLVIAGPFFGAAQGKDPVNRNASYTVRGEVTDSLGTNSLRYATLLFKGRSDSSAKKTVVTDSMGLFTTTLNFNEGTVEVYALGYKKNITKFSFGSEAISFIALHLQGDPKYLDNVTVNTKRKLIETIPGGYEYNAELNISAGNGTANNLLQQVPGITVDTKGILLRGSPGVNVYIDGKPTNISGKEVLAYLQQISATDIKSVAVYIVPSAKFDAQGSAGIIDIRMKRNLLQGKFGSYDIGISTHDKYNASARINYKTEKVSFFLNGGLRHDNNRSTVTTEIVNKLSADSARYNRFYSETPDRKGNSANINTGIDVLLDKHNSIGGSFKWYSSSSSYVSSLLGNVQNGSFQQRSNYLINQYSEGSGDRFMYDLNFIHDFKKEGRKFTIDFNRYDYKRLSDLSTVSFFSKTTVTGDSLSTQRKQTNAAGHVTFVQLDYSDVFKNKMSFETGMKLNFATNNNLYKDYLQDNSTKQYNLQIATSNDFWYDENVYSGYINIRRSLKKISYQIGIRAELTRVDFKSLDYNVPKHQLGYDSSYLNIFPNIYFKYQVKPSFDIALSMSKRIERPYFNYLNPFADNSNPYLINSGNPYLIPINVSTINLSIAKAWKDKHSLLFSAAYLYLRNAFDYMTLRSDTNNLVYINKPVNFNSGGVFGLFANGSNQVAKWLRLNSSVSVYRKAYNAENLNIVLPSGMVSCDASISGDVKLNTVSNLQLRYAYQSPGNSFEGTYASVNYLNISYRYSIVKENIVINLDFSDVFNNSRIRSTTNTQYIQLIRTTKYESSVLSLRFLKTFGKRKTNKVKHVNTDETGRFRD